MDIQEICQLSKVKCITLDDIPVNSQRDWNIHGLSGSLIEISGRAVGGLNTFAASLIVDAQRNQELCAWISKTDISFFPPDMLNMGIDLDSLPIIRIDNVKHRYRIVDRLLTSGGFRLIVVDLTDNRWIPDKIQLRLSNLTLKRNAVVLCLTRNLDKPGYLNTLVPVRAEVELQHIRNNQFMCLLKILKDKRRTPGWTAERICYAQDCLC